MCLQHVNGTSKSNVSDASTLFFLDFLRAQTRFELSKVKLYRDDLRENKNYFELAEGSSYRGFELPRVKLQWMYGGNPGVRVSERLSYREPTVYMLEVYRALQKWLRNANFYLELWWHQIKPTIFPHYLEYIYRISSQCRKRPISMGCAYLAHRTRYTTHLQKTNTIVQMTNSSQLHKLWRS